MLFIIPVQFVHFCRAQLHTADHVCKRNATVIITHSPCLGSVCREMWSCQTWHFFFLSLFWYFNMAVAADKLALFIRSLVVVFLSRQSLPIFLFVLVSHVFHWKRDQKKKKTKGHARIHRVASVRSPVGTMIIIFLYDSHTIIINNWEKCVPKPRTAATAQAHTLTIINIYIFPFKFYLWTAVIAFFMHCDVHPRTHVTDVSSRLDRSRGFFHHSDEATKRSHFLSPYKVYDLLWEYVELKMNKILGTTPNWNTMATMH